MRRSQRVAELTLATAAETGGTASDADRGQRAPTGETRLAGPAIDEELFLLAADLSPCVAVGVDRAASICDRQLERLAKRLVQAPRRFLAQRAGDPVRPKSCLVQRLVRVDVAYPGDRALVEQHGLDRRASIAQPAVKLIGGKTGIDWFRTETRHFLRREQRLLGAKQQTAETTRVAVAKLMAVVEKEHGMRVVLWRRGGVD